MLKHIKNIFFKKINKNNRIINQYLKQIEIINSYEKDFELLTDDELKAKINEYKLSNEHTIEKSFAFTREASKRILNMRHYDVQLMGGLALVTNNIAEMKTGEGKTLVASLPAIHKVITGKKVHIVTVNDYLAKRDMEFLKPLYDFFNISCSFNKKEMDYQNLSYSDKKNIYNSDIVYGTNSEFAFDYLRSNSVKNRNDIFFEDDFFQYVIIDEVDSVLIDDASNPLILSETIQEEPENFHWANDIVKNLLIRSDTDIEVFLNNFIEVKNAQTYTKNENIDVNGDYFYDDAIKSIHLFESAYEKIENYLINKNIINHKNELYGGGDKLHYINNAIHAYCGYLKDRDYIVNENGEVIIVDISTGRLFYNGRWRNGLHQAIECKENVEIKSENKTVSQITYQSFFNLYKEKSGMTGTADTEAYELFSVYNLETIIIPTNKEIKRIDYQSNMYVDKKRKYADLIKVIEEKNKKGQPILIGTPALYISEEIANLLKEGGFKFNILNAKNHEREAEIIQNAGKLNSITISTNMAGRGTDIILGGNIQPQLENVDNNEMLSESDKEKEKKRIIEDWHENRNLVIESGGLCVMGVEKNPARRIDNQLRGRAGRQGEIGESWFFLSLDDEIMLQNVKENVLNYARNFFNKFDGIKNRDINNISKWDKIFENAQKTVENRNSERRKFLLDYDSLLIKQRKTFYNLRKEILVSDNDKIEQFFNDYLLTYVKNIIKNNELSELDNNKLKDFSLNLLLNIFKSNIRNKDENDDVYQDILKIKPIIDLNYNKDNFDFNEDLFVNLISQHINYIYNRLWENIKIIEGDNSKFDYIRLTILETFDDLWSSFLSSLEITRKGAYLTSYAQKNPLNEFKKNSHTQFIGIIDSLPILSIEKMLSENMKIDLIDINDLKNYKFSGDIKNMKPEEVVNELKHLTNKMLQSDLIRDKKN